ncbi:2,4-diketo-3-deoxy-L-fuconate hydrolase [Bradyrhizobium sp. S3.12.5]|uniref:fumarylacetoacetate hydrolase family protein n=1 Tax=Bradyrhizobium sp. S3.12.5 TaxID=3156386 RepID=UPI003391C1FF
MKLLRYGLPGQESPAILDANGRARDLSEHIADLAGANLLPESLAAIKDLDLERLPFVADRQRIGPCVGGVGKIICVGLNYRDHAAEAGMAVPQEPILFLKPSSAINGPNDDVIIPRGSEKTDWEVELGVVIGTPGAYIPESDALDHVAGYCLANDVSERSYQLERGGQWDKGKGCDTFAPIGPWLVTPDEIADPHNLNLWLDVDGRREQEGNTRTMVFGIPKLISHISEFMSLKSGDVIMTGTPPGVGMGRTPPLYLRAGQRIQLGITGLGAQEQLLVPSRIGA